MAMNLPGSSHPFCIPTVLIVTILHLLLSPASCLDQHYTSDSTQGFLLEDKARLGSTPPSCHNKCNQCHPCMAVQIPTLPSHDRVQHGQSKNPTTRDHPMDFFDSSPSSAGNRYSNYKPLGWKCRCGNHFYNP